MLGHYLRPYRLMQSDHICKNIHCIHITPRGPARTYSGQISQSNPSTLYSMGRFGCTSPSSSDGALGASKFLGPPTYAKAV